MVEETTILSVTIIIEEILLNTECFKQQAEAARSNVKSECLDAVGICRLRVDT